MSHTAAQVEEEVEEIFDEASDDSSVEAAEEASQRHDLPPQAKRQRRFYDNKHPLEGERNGRYGHVDLEIKYLQEEYTGALIPKETFKKYVNSVIKQLGNEYDDDLFGVDVNSFRITKEAYATLQEGTEQYMTSLFTKANRLAIRAKRQVIYVSDLNEAIALSKPSEHFAPQQAQQEQAASGQGVQ